MFCTNCGKQMNPGESFCSACGFRKDTGSRPTQRQTVYPQYNQPYPQGEPVHPQYKPPSTCQAQPHPQAPSARKGKSKVIPVLISILLIVLAIGSVMLSLVGKSTNAKVTGIEQDYRGEGDATRYRLSYEFIVDGQTYTGSVARSFKDGSQYRGFMKIRYLPFWPAINGEDSSKGLLGGLVIGAGGIALLVFALKSKSSRKSP